MKNVFLLAALLLITACGGGGSGSHKGNVSTSFKPENVALAANGASVSATYDEFIGATYVIDGDFSTANYWAANVTGDQIIVDFGELYSLEKLTIYTNATTGSLEKDIELSSNGSTWLKTAQPGGDIECEVLQIGLGEISCEFEPVQNARYVRVVITEADDPDLIQIYEIEALGY